MVTSDYFTAHILKEIRQMAATLSEKINYLQPGTAAPGICLPSGDNLTWCSTANTLTYLYILFADLEIPVCREQVKYLKTMAEKTGSQVQFLIVLTPSQKVNNTEFLSRNQIPGIMVTVAITVSRSPLLHLKLNSYESGVSVPSVRRFRWYAVIRSSS